MTTMFPSQAPGLRWWERLRMQLCTFGPECRWTWVGVVTCSVYAMVLHYCFLLLFRFLLHSILLCSTIAVLGYGYATHILQKNLENADRMPARHATVIRTKTIPNTPHPQIPQKTFCWLELPSEDNAVDVGTNHTSSVEDRIERIGSSTTAISKVVGLEVGNLTPNITDNDDEEDDGEDVKDWIHVPCVIAQEHDTSNGTPGTPPPDRIQKGDRITVRLLDGDASRLIYVPYQKLALKRMHHTVARSLMWFGGAYLALMVIFRGTPVVFASSQQLEESLNAFSDWCFTWLENTLSFLDDDKTTDEDIDADERGCRIPWFVAAGYDVLLLVQIAVPAAMFFYIRWKKNQLLEETPTGTYHLLRGDEDEQEVSAKAGTGSASSS